MVTVYVRKKGGIKREELFEGREVNQGWPVQKRTIHLIEKEKIHAFPQWMIKTREALRDASFKEMQSLFLPARIQTEQPSEAQCCPRDRQRSGQLCPRSTS
jgi:hypothetical protein